MKTYRIERRVDVGVIAKVVAEHGEYFLPHIAVHSPTGFETGYGESGPSDLALSILADHFGESEASISERMGSPRGPSRAWSLHHAFKVAFIAPRPLVPGESYTITEPQIREWVERQEPR